jgi:dinuclear metal center YbgI/SA1388 family protein
MKLFEIINFLEKKYPSALAEDWDNVGLLIGDEMEEVRSVMVCLEITNHAIMEAIHHDVDLIICHHPVIFKGLTTINYNEAKGYKIKRLIESKIAVYAMHTNIDSAVDGLGDWFADLFEYDKKEALIPRKTEYYKVIYYVPEDNHEEVLEKVFKAGGGHIGYYDSCSFSSVGTGTFRPLENTNPAIGTHGVVEHVNELKVEVITDDLRLKGVVKELLKAHPYEEVAYDVLKLVNKPQVQKDVLGIGRIINLKEPMNIDSIVKVFKENLYQKDYQYAGSNELFSRIAICPGSGNDEINIALRKGVDLYVSGDLKFHETVDALEEGLSILDIGHVSEELFTSRMAILLNRNFPELKIKEQYMKNLYVNK